MIKKITLLFFLTISYINFSQVIQVNQTNSHELFAKSLNNSKDLMYEDILNKYDTYISKNPNDISTKISRCKFIGEAYYDEYDGYDINYDLTEKCVDELYASYPTHPEVILYKLDYLYGEDKSLLLEEKIELHNQNELDWTYQQLSKLYEVGAYLYTDDNERKAVSYAQKAEKYSDSLDLSVLITNGYLNMGNKENAKESLMSALFRDQDAWTLKQKGELLIDFDENEEALKIFERVKQKDSTIIDNINFYKIFIKNKEYNTARDYLLKDTIAEWGKISSIQILLNHDISYSEPQVALDIYRRMQTESFYDDFFGIKRLKLFFKGPTLSWNLTDFSHIFILILTIFIAFLVPYLWILPIYFLGRFKKTDQTIKLVIPFDWNLKHFWMISFAIILIDLLVTFLFNYQTTMNYLFDLTIDNTEESSSNMAIYMLAYILMSFVVTLLFFNKERLKYLFRSKVGVLRIVSLSIAFILVNFLVLRFLKTFVDLSFLPPLDIKEEINSLIVEYGIWIALFLVAILVPIYEEVIFRGIIFSSIEKYLGFWKANVIQATLFSLLHMNLTFFIYYFIFGIMLGVMVNRSKGLIVGIIFHSINNTIAVYALYQISKYNQNLELLNDYASIILP